ncbi:hypothetical protein JCM11251_003341 [Rhodosporidiobolus azoricus]
MATSLIVGAGATTLATASSVGVPAGFMRDYWTAGIMVLGLCLLAYLTNPDPASFRTHITSQCFHTHLRRLSSSPARPPAHSSASSATASSSTSSSTDKKDSSSASTSATATAANGNNKRKGSSKQPSSASSSTSSAANRHILSFSNRISLSIKTPSYKFTSYHLFSAVFVPPPSTSSRTTSATTKKHQQQLKKNPELGALLGLGGELWLGVFGKWYALKLWENEEMEEEERRGRLERGVKEMSVEDDDKNLDYPSYASSAAPSVSASASGSSTPAHTLPSTALDRSSSLTSPPASDSAPPLSPTGKSGPAAANKLAKRVFRAGQRRCSPTSLTRLKTKAEHAAKEAAEAERAAADEAASSAADAASSAKGGDAAVAGAEDGTMQTDPVLIELQAQLDELRASAAEGEKRLQDELEVLRGKKRDEDAFRAELKAKTKTLEEAKRVAEAAKVEAEKELGERKGAVKEVQGRVDRLREEIRKLERKGIEVVERKEKKRRDRREREKKLKEDVGRKRDELREKEKGLEEVLQKVGEMERKLEVRRSLLASRRTELAQLAVAGVRGGPGVVNPHPSQPMSASHQYLAAGPPPPSAIPATATLGGVGAIANAFAVPFGQGAYGRRNYPYVHPLSANNSRPTSIRSGHFDPHTGAFQSAPSSPTLSHPVSPLDDALAPYGGADAASGWPTSFAPLPPNGTAPAHSSGSFLEHRLQHRAATSGDDAASHFLPFDFDSLAAGDGASPPLRSARAGSLAGGAGGEDRSPGGSIINKPRPPLALPLQYLDSGLLATSTPSGLSGDPLSPGLDNGPLSPMTPHQTSLIPSQLFHMLDDDDDDDGLFYNLPDSPTLRGANILGGDWRGLGLDVDDLGGASGAVSRRGSGDSKEEKTASSLPPPVPEETEEDEEEHPKNEVDMLEELGTRSADVVSPHADTFNLLPGSASATSSPLGPSPTSPFSPWNDAPSGVPSALEAALAVGSGGVGMHRLSPSQDLNLDDLPRAGLSLNPDAKAFAFPFSAAPGSQANAHARTASVPSPPSQLAAVASTARAARSGTASSFPGSSLPSPTTLAPPVSGAPSFAFGAVVEPPAKSRMEFANRSSLDQQERPPLSARLSPGFDWPAAGSTSKSSSPNLAPAIAPIGTGPASRSSTPVPKDVSSTASASSSSSFNPFNPFDEEDELLGPLRK